MKVVIDIPDNIFKKLVAGEIHYGGITAKRIFNMVKEGTLLPKGHGRLIDADDVTDFEGHYITTDAPTIIEADEE